MNHKSLFFKYVIPSIIAFALSGIYAIVDGYFVGNTIGDAGISAINIAYPIEALIQALGTGIGMGGAVYYSINAYMIAIAAVTPCPAIVAVAAPFMPISYIHTKIKYRTILVMNPPTIANIDQKEFP